MAYQIRHVWAPNLEYEFRVLNEVLQRHNHVALHTEYPGNVARPIGEFRTEQDYQYQVLRCNARLVKVVQIGLSFFDHIGNARPNCCTWQFNFNFSLWKDMYAAEPISRLAESGIPFRRHAEEGIDPYEFAQAITASGLVLSDQVHWLTYLSRHDFGFMLKMLTNRELPEEESDFDDLVHQYFPSYCHVKTIADSHNMHLGTLDEVSEQFHFRQIGPRRQAGNSSLFTGAAFFRLRAMYI